MSLSAQPAARPLTMLPPAAAGLHGRWLSAPVLWELVLGENALVRASGRSPSPHPFSRGEGLALF